MDFKFKEVVEESIIYFYDQVLSPNEYTEDVFEELDQVYAQAAKADEYEAKAKAFDFIREARKEVLTDVQERGLKLPTDLDKFSMMTERIINKYESGESDGSTM